MYKVSMARRNKSSQKDGDLPGAHNAEPYAAADVTRRMLCGALAGMIAKTATNPLERIKMLSQTGETGIMTAHHHKTQPAQLGVLQLYRHILAREGVRGLWAGNATNLIRIMPSKSIVFASNDVYQNMLRQLSGTSPDRHLSAPLSFLAGGLAGMTASGVTYPLDLARGRIAGKLAVVLDATGPAPADGGGAGGSGSRSAAIAAKKHYGGMLQTIKLTVQEEGFFALYKGLTPTLLGAMPYEGIKFGTVGVLEMVFPRHEHDSASPSSSSPLRKMIMGGTGGILAGILTYPNDTVRRLLQLQGSRGTTTTYTGYWDCVQHTYRHYGITRFYRGLTINLIRMAPNAAIQFGSYELLKQWTAEWIR